MAEKKRLERKYYCGQLGESQTGEILTVFGWVNNKRELGGLTFMDLRDRTGLLQVKADETFADKKLLKGIGREYVLAVSGEVVRRSNPNPNLPTGQIELAASQIDILAESELPPFFPDNTGDVSEELRFEYRYLDLRSSRLQKNFRLRSEASLRIRNYLNKSGFVDIETPILTKATPEGARDYLVPSRIYKGRMFALPQSPQLFKQLLMVSGFERYYQLARCFRDEDLRADRQPEFTQVDVEMSFAQPAELFETIEGLMVEIFSLSDRAVLAPFPIIDYETAMNEYGSDKPDLRIPFKIRDFSASAAELNSTVIDQILASGGRVKGLVLPDSAGYSRKIIDQLNQFIREIGGKGLIWMKWTEAGFKSPLKTDPRMVESFFEKNLINREDIVLLIGDDPQTAASLCGRLRLHLGQSFQDPNRLDFCWITDFPLFFFNSEENRLDSNHHPFTSPRMDEVHLLDKDPLSVKSVAYDLVLNGVEIGGGSQRINDIKLQRRIFELLNLSALEIDEKFSFFLNALSYGAPPHLGIALGFDRIMMLLSGEDSIRETIAFPKTTSSLCLLTGSPSQVSSTQLDELGISTKSSED